VNVNDKETRCLHVWLHCDKPCYSVAAVLEPIIEADNAKDYLARYVNPTLLQGLTALCKRKPAEPFVSCILYYTKMSPI